MVELTRTVRFCINAAPAQPGEPHNTFAAHPSMQGLGRFYEIEVACRGQIDPTTGYFVNIKTIDQAVRSAAVPMIAQACFERPTADPASLLPNIVTALNHRLDHTIARVRWKLTPYYSLEMSPASTPTPNTVLLRQQFEFAASHRLHCPSLSDDENRKLFGKCNHAGGHGHNYRVEPCVELPVVEGHAPPALSLADLERLTNQHIIERYDHKHLNTDTPEFSPEQGGVNPSVENIARLCHDRLKPAIHSASRGQASLHSVTVWETDKTSCRYPI